tara:strand:- start:71 stop:520 length:450 start_codon:yes stop_codon:yes gene_type:complete
MNNKDWLLFERKVKFGDCDSANVIHFHNLFRWGHEYWEESLDLYGISHHEIFPNSKLKQEILLPIVSSESKFFLPIKHGDILKVKLMPKKINNHLFQVNTYFFFEKIKAAETKITHCAISNNSRQKVNIPENLELWIEASNLSNSVQEC